jgi:hypothetical protein
MQKKPRTITVGGEKFVSTVMRVVEKDELGRPLLLRVMRPGESVPLSKDPEANVFIVPFVKEGSV